MLELNGASEGKTTGNLALGHFSLAAADRIEVAIASLAVMGFGLTIAGIAIQTIVQSEVDEMLRGRVMSVYGVMWIGSPGLGALIMGVMNNGMSIIGVGIDWQQVIKGLVLLAAVIFDVYNKNKA